MSNPVAPAARYLGTEGDFYTPKVPWFTLLPVDEAQAKADSDAVVQMIDVVTSVLMDAVCEQLPDVAPEVIDRVLGVSAPIVAYRALTLGAVGLEHSPDALTGEDASLFMRWFGLEHVVAHFGETLPPLLSNAIGEILATLDTPSTNGETNE